ncbi:ABC transporter ATP-binding protein [Anaerovibrio sp.]|uniref:ABC transporter ATP-binding protein n=1 Tax=Anaerovibrio sp. TaxID=1872532 RepID=UPI003F16EFD4
MLKVKNVGKHYVKDGRQNIILSDVSLNVGPEEFVCLLGPSGCGKSTLLRLMSGLEQPDTGGIYQHGRLVEEPQPECAFVFQHYALFPWKTVLENVTFGMEVQKKYSRQECLDRAREYLRLMHLEGYENSYIHELSGGMCQRTAIARGLALEPEILFMDEPFGALDNFTRMELQDLLLEICSSRRLGIVFVTHDIDESIYLGDRVVIMDANPGRIHTVIDIDRRLVQDRTSDDFYLYKEKILQVFDLVHKKDIEYFI